MTKNPLATTRSTQPLILAIETSCDETAVAVTQGTTVISSLVSSQIKEHEPYGGVVPELASRKHTTSINYLIERSLTEAQIDLDRIEAIAVSKGPGLVGALIVGMAAAKTLALTLDIPLIPVNHIEAHMFSVFSDNADIKPPFITLIVSGGHTMLVYVSDLGQYKLLGQTLDDAAGEAFDKVAKFIGLPYPGGPQIDRISKEGNENKFNLPRPMLKSGDYDFSFSGLKTAVIYLVRKLEENGEKYKKEDLAASFQKAVVEVLREKTFKAAYQYKVGSVAVVGGVVANSYLRDDFKRTADGKGLKLALPSQKLSTDNAAMVGLAGYFKYKNKVFSDSKESVDPNWPLPLV